MSRRVRDLVPADVRQTIKWRASNWLATYPPDPRALLAIADALDGVRQRVEAGAPTTGPPRQPSIWAISMVRNEQEVIRSTVLQLWAEGVDRVVVLDNGSTDRTRLELEELRVFHPGLVIADLNVQGYYQGAVMTRLARLAGRLGADWIVPFDADELWRGAEQPLRDVLAAQHVRVVEARVYEHVPRLDDDTSIADPFRRIEHRRPDVWDWNKVAFRPTARVRVHQGNHDVSLGGPRAGGLEVRHFPVRTEDQLVAKIAQGRRAMRRSRIHSSLRRPWGDPWCDDEADALRQWKQTVTSEPVVRDPARPGYAGLHDDP